MKLLSNCLPIFLQPRRCCCTFISYYNYYCSRYISYTSITMIQSSCGVIKKSSTSLTPTSQQHIQYQYQQRHHQQQRFQQPRIINPQQKRSLFVSTTSLHSDRASESKSNNMKHRMIPNGVKRVFNLLFRRNITTSSSLSSTNISSTVTTSKNNKKNKKHKRQQHKQQQQQRPERQERQEQHQTNNTIRSLSSSSTSSSPLNASSSTTPSNPVQVLQYSSKRGYDAVQLLPSYLTDARSVSLYNKDTNPNGAIQVSVAETKLMEDDWLIPSFNTFQQTTASDSTTSSSLGDAIYYQPTSGRNDLKDVISNYMIDLLELNNKQSNSTTSSSNTNNTLLQKDGIIIGAGCNAVLENLCFVLTNVNDIIMIPSPYYAAFEFDLIARIQCQIRSIHPNITSTTTTTTNNNRIDPSIYYPTIETLDRTYNECLSRNEIPKILLLSNPNNPLGIYYPKHVIETCIDWCNEHHIHLISDEIYAGSVYYNNYNNDNHDESSNPFMSTLKVAHEMNHNNQNQNNNSSVNGLGLGPYIHWVYALSKDYALSGLRVGIAYTENNEIQLPFSKLNDLCQVSSLTQLYVKNMLSYKIPLLSSSSSNPQDHQQRQHHDDGNKEIYWYRAYQKENLSRIRQRVDMIVPLLNKYNIPFIFPTAGLYIWIDLSTYLPTKSTDDNNQRERILYLQLINEYQLLFTPGCSMKHDYLPGCFRFVFTAVSYEEFHIALQRLEQFFIEQ